METLPDQYASVEEREGGRPRERRSGFQRQLLALFRHHIPEGARVLDWGCGSGDLLRGLKPSRGLGIDPSAEWIQAARKRSDNGECEFEIGDPEERVVEEKFDHIVANYLTGHLEDIQRFFHNLLRAAEARTRLHVTSLNPLWLFPLTLGEDVGAIMRHPPDNWLSGRDIENLLELSGWEVVSRQTEQLFPFEWPLVSSVANRFLVRCPYFRRYGITLHLIARPRIRPEIRGPVSCSVVVPARNEAGNIRPALERIPVLGERTEVVFVEGNSVDDTWEVIRREVDLYDGPHLVRAIRQPGKGKWDAVKSGFAVARGEVVVIQDADLTAPPEDLPKFYEAIASGAAEMANGSRLVYPMEAKAMRFLNLLGNGFFAGALSFVLGQPIKDSLCGTKMMLRKDYQRAMKRLEAFGDFDPFGDFSLLFGSALLGLRIRDVPVRYKQREYGDTNISRFRHGMQLMRMTVFGLRRIRFFPLRMRPRWRK